MITRLLSAALVAGFLASVVATGLQLALTSPLILQAETYEGEGAHAALAPTTDAPFAALIVPAHAPSQHSHGEGGHDHGKADEWQPAPGLQRMAFTGLATLVGGVGYALLLAAVMLALRREPTPQSGLVVGVAGFLAVALAPAIGLPPELPGMGAAPLVLRQSWWLMTVIATGLGLYLIAVRRVPLTILGGLVLGRAVRRALARHRLRVRGGDRARLRLGLEAVRPRGGRPRPCLIPMPRPCPSASPAARRVTRPSRAPGPGFWPRCTRRPTARRCRD